MPVDTGVNMRPIIKYEEVKDLINQIPMLSTDMYENQNPRMIKEQYQAVMHSHYCIDMLKLIKTKYTKQKTFNKENKTVKLDNNRIKLVEELLYGEFVIALAKEKPARGIILHSDQGCQFTSWAFVDYCKSNGVMQSMSKSGCPYDNAAMERFYNTFKSELIYRNSFANEECLDVAVSKYIYLWYNYLRPHSHNNWKTPYEMRYGY